MTHDQAVPEGWKSQDWEPPYEHPANHKIVIVLSHCRTLPVRPAAAADDVAHDDAARPAGSGASSRHYQAIVGLAVPGPVVPSVKRLMMALISSIGPFDFGKKPSCRQALMRSEIRS